MDSINKSAVVIGLTAAVAVSFVAMSASSSSSSKTKKTRRAKMNCTCGKVEAELYMPAANYKYAESPSFQCACHDCVGFVDKVKHHVHAVVHA